MKIGELEQRLLSFLGGLEGSECIDEMDNSRTGEGKRADFLLDNRNIVCEIKSIKQDGESRVDMIHEELKRREEYPLFYGEIEMKALLGNFPDKDEINKKLYKAVTSRIESSFKKANQQIKAVRSKFNIPKAKGLIIFINELDFILSPEIFTHKIFSLYGHKKSNGLRAYSSIHAVWLLNTKFYSKAIRGTKAYPQILLLNTFAGLVDPYIDKYLGELQHKWARFQDVPLYELPEGTSLESLMFVKDIAAKEELTRHEVWRKCYRSNRYMQSWEENKLLAHGGRLMGEIMPGVTVGHSKEKPTHERMKILWEQYSHFLEEAKMRGLDFRKLGPYVEKETAALFGDS